MLKGDIVKHVTTVM